jgi:Raf kinase inhibitor-like YbhB/YbcL family protein
MFKLRSKAFSDSQSIPTRHALHDWNASPPLEWEGAPAGTKSFALIVDDPDAPDPRAPQRTWVHWVAYDIPAAAHALRENGSQEGMPAGARQGRNDWNHARYDGPAPPTGKHRYFHKLYALDTTLRIDRADKAQLLAAMQGHVLAEAQLIGTFEAGRRNS